MQRYSFYVGLDLGQSQDYTALAVLEEPAWIPGESERFALNAPAEGWVSPAALTPQMLALARDREERRDRPARPALAVRHLERLPLGTPYPAVVDRVVSLIQSEPLLGRSPVLVVDHTGVGRPVVDSFRQRLDLVAITITAGDSVSKEGADFRVPKRDLVGVISVLLEARPQRIQIARSLPEASVLVKELQGFQRRMTPLGHDSYLSWREQDHDDLVLAVALAAWYREWYNVHLDRPRGESFSICRNGHKNCSLDWAACNRRVRAG